jgi:2-hydroxychromene-2-carboxylate isomerase
VDSEYLANRVGGAVSVIERWRPEYTKATYRAWLLKDKLPGDPEHLCSILSTLGRPEGCGISGNLQEIRRKYASETSWARTIGLFGSPTFAIGNEMFWGEDRLEDALE